MGTQESKVNCESDFYKWFTRNGFNDVDAETLYKRFGKINIRTVPELREFGKDSRFKTFVEKNLTTRQAFQMGIVMGKDRKREEKKNDINDNDSESDEKNRWKDNNPNFTFSNMTKGNITRLNKKRPMIMGRFSKVWKYGPMDFHQSIRLIYFSKEETEQLESTNKKVRPKLFVRVFTVELKYDTTLKRKILRIHGPLVNRMQICRYKCNEYICLENMCINDIVDIARTTMDTFGEFSYYKNYGKKNCRFFADQLMQAIKEKNDKNNNKAQTTKNLRNLGIDCQTVQNYISEHYCENLNFKLKNNNDSSDSDSDGDGNDTYEITHIRVGYDDDDEILYEKKEGMKRKEIKSKAVSLVEIINDPELQLPNENNKIYSSVLYQQRPLLRIFYKETFAVLTKDGYFCLYDDDKRNQLLKLDLFRKSIRVELDQDDESGLQFRIGMYDVFKTETPEQRNIWKRKIDQLISTSQKDLTVCQTISGQ